MGIYAQYFTCHPKPLDIGTYTPQKFKQEQYIDLNCTKQRTLMMIQLIQTANWISKQKILYTIDTTTSRPQNQHGSS